MSATCSPNSRDTRPERIPHGAFGVCGSGVTATIQGLSADRSAPGDNGTDAPDGEYALVTLLVGANNCLQGPEEFHPKLTAILERAIGFAPGPEQVIVRSVPDYTLTPVGQQNDQSEHASRLTAYNGVIEAEAADAGTRFVDVVPPSEQVVDRPELVAEDDLHPSGKQYDR